MTNLALIPTLPGQIVRVYLENFMTYNAIEVRPGFHLNMIIGPNGTGKSTIACAVLLGLGGKLKTLSRGNHLSSYVKSGCSQSLIEVELYCSTGENVTIRRQITITNQSQFFINGESASASKVADVRNKFNIQVDNLCTFLPQEKVHDFAKMNPQQLLEHTQRTIDGELIQTFEELKAFRSEVMNCENNKRVQEEALQAEIARNERISGKVKAIREKQALFNRVEHLNQKKGWLHYHSTLSRRKEIDKDVQEAKKVVEERKIEVDKYSQQLRQIEKNSEQQQEACKEARREESGKRSVVDDRIDWLQRRINRYSNLKKLFKARESEESKKLTEIRQVETSVSKLKNDLQEMDRSRGDSAKLQKEDHSLAAKQREIQERDAKLAHLLGTTEDDTRSVEQELRNASSQRRLLENRKGQRLEYLRKNEPDAFRAVQWLEKNQKLFQSKVYNPMLLEMNVPDPSKAKFVEAVIPYADLMAFTTTSGEDLNLMVRKLRVEMKLKISVVTAEANQNTQFAPSVPLSRLRAYGFSSYLKDAITAPEPIMRYLCRQHAIHNIPIGNQDTDESCDKVPVPRFLSATNLFTVKVSAYSGERATVVKKMKDPKFFSASVDEASINRLVALEESLSEKLTAHQKALDEYAQQQSTIRTELGNIGRSRREVATQLEEQRQAKEQLQRMEEQLKCLKGSMCKPEEIKAQNEKEKETLANEIERSFLDVRKAFENFEKAVLSRSRKSLALKAVRAGVEKIKLSQHEASSALKEMQELLRAAESKLNAAVSECTRAKAEARRLTNGIGPESKEFKKFEKLFKQLPDTLDDLDAELEEAQDRAEFLDGGSGQILHEYMERETEIERMKKQAAEMGSKLADKQNRLVQIKNSWLQPIQELVGKINVNFDKYFVLMNCSGEVTLCIPQNEDDFAEYGIKIRVKFRDGVPLQELSGHFQSGGERAVATAIYLLSLQHLTSVPFRFVDEINQGMDRINERRITELILRVTAHKDSSQYFFITPKLLGGLKCPDNMSVLCVYNGPNVIPTANWDLSRFIQRAKGQTDGDDDASF